MRPFELILSPYQAELVRRAIVTHLTAESAPVTPEDVRNLTAIARCFDSQRQAQLIQKEPA